MSSRVGRAAKTGVMGGGLMVAVLRPLLPQGALGHDRATTRAQGIPCHLRPGHERGGHGAAALPSSMSLPRPGADAVRGLVITGGHDHETSFYSLFDGYDDLAPMPVTSSATAFQGDLRGKYDVLIMYDFTRDLDETGKKNLRDFVESGKGSWCCIMPCSTIRSGPGGTRKWSAAAIA